MPMELALNKATLIKRYKRFLADIILANEQTTTCHVANTGAMTGCAEPGDFVWYSTSTNAKRKYPLSWELTQTQRSNDFICVNTSRANTLMVEAINSNTIAELIGYNELSTEVKYGSENSRIDILLSDSKQPDAYIEVKSVTLLEGNHGYFPDAVTTRGQKHLRELISMVEQGNRAILLFAVLHTGIEQVSPADHIDAAYGKLIREAKSKGVEILAYKADISPASMVINSAVPVTL